MKQLPILILVMSMLLVGRVCSQEESATVTLLEKGDAAFAAFDNSAALEFYRQALEQDSLNYEANWKLARAYVDVGEVKEDKKERRRDYRTAEKFARRAVRVDSMGSQGHLFLSIALGRVALDAGAKERVRLSKEIKAEVDRALALDPNDDIAWHVLGRWHRKIATLSWIERKFANLFLGGVPKEASVEKAAECFQKAIEIRPEHIHHHLELGMTYEKLKKKELAAEEYQKVLDLPRSDADDESYKATARERLRKLK